MSRSCSESSSLCTWSYFIYTDRASEFKKGRTREIAVEEGEEAKFVAIRVDDEAADMEVVCLR